MYTFDLHPEIFVIFVIIFTAIKTCILKFKHVLSYRNIILSIIKIVYFLLLIKIAILPITIGAEDSFGIRFEIRSGIQLVPFYTIRKALTERNWIQVIGNILLIMPLPILISISNESVKKKTLFLFVLCTSLGIEVIQLLINIASRFPNHVTDIDDVILNVAGGGIAIKASKMRKRITLSSYFSKKNKDLMLLRIFQECVTLFILHEMVRFYGNLTWKTETLFLIAMTSIGYFILWLVFLKRNKKNISIFFVCGYPKNKICTVVYQIMFFEIVAGCLFGNLCYFYFQSATSIRTLSLENILSNSVILAGSYLLAGFVMIISYIYQRCPSPLKHFSQDTASSGKPLSK